MLPQTKKKIELYLYNYKYLDIRIKSIFENRIDSEYNQGYKRYLKNKSSSLENQVIKNLEIEKRINKLQNWKTLINKVLEEYKNTNNLKYRFIELKYFNKANPIIIENKLNIDIDEQKDIRNEILQYIYLMAINENILKEVK